MKKILVVLLTMGILPLYSVSQSLVTKKIFSPSVGDSVLIKVWLPENYSSGESYPVIYDFIYDHSGYIAATAANIWDIPKVIVVWAKIEGGNEDYKSPRLTEKGDKYYAFVKNELIRYITEQYHTAKFRAAAGLSQGADYLNYILRNDPSLFNSYLLFSLEYPVHYTPSLSSYTAKIRDTTSYYLAIADDTEQRVKFANQLYDSLKSSPFIKIKKEQFGKASHPYSIMYALPDALLYAFGDYGTVRQKRPDESLIKYYTSTLNEKKQIYGNINFHGFLPQVIRLADISKSSVPEINELIDSIYLLKESMDIDLVNLGYQLRSKSLYDNAEKAYKLALLKKELTGISAMDDVSMYFQLFKVCDLAGKTNEAIKILKEGYEKTKQEDEGLLYTLGYYYIDKKIEVNKGIDLLLSLLAGQHKVSNFWTKRPDEVCTRIAMGYWQLKNKKQAKAYVDKALSINPKNAEALQLKTSLK